MLWISEIIISYSMYCTPTILPRYVSVPSYFNNLPTLPRKSLHCFVVNLINYKKVGSQSVNNWVPLKLYIFEKYKYWFTMLNKDLGQRPQSEIPWESSIHPIYKDTHAMSRVDKSTTHEHTVTPWYKHALQCHIFRKPFLNISLQPPTLFADTHLYTLPPFFTSPYSSIHSSLRWAPNTPLKWLIKDPEHHYRDAFLSHSKDVLFRHSAHLNWMSHSLREIFPSLGSRISHFSNFLFISLAVPSRWPSAGPPYMTSGSRNSS